MKAKATIPAGAAEQQIPPHSINLLNQYIHVQADKSGTFLRSFQVALFMSHVRCSTVNMVTGPPSCVLFRRMQENRFQHPGETPSPPPHPKPVSETAGKGLKCKYLIIKPNKIEMPYLHLLFCSFCFYFHSGSVPRTDVQLGDKTKNTEFSQTRARSKIIGITRTIYLSRI